MHNTNISIGNTIQPITIAPHAITARGGSESPTLLIPFTIAFTPVRAGHQLLLYFSRYTIHRRLPSDSATDRNPVPYLPPFAPVRGPRRPIKFVMTKPWHFIFPSTNPADHADGPKLIASLWNGLRMFLEANPQYIL
jgi:hypothetical protein